MAKKKSVSSLKNGRESNSKRLGVKLFGGNKVKPGGIIIRQNGCLFYPGINCYLSRNYSIHSIINGIVYFNNKIINVF